MNCLYTVFQGAFCPKMADEKVLKVFIVFLILGPIFASTLGPPSTLPKTAAMELGSCGFESNGKWTLKIGIKYSTIHFYFFNIKLFTEAGPTGANGLNAR